jgi:thiol-disulfide isomerase/thioredoxin
MSAPGFSDSDELKAAVARPASGCWVFWPWIALAAALLIFVGYKILFPLAPADRGATHHAVGAKIEQMDLPPLTGNANPLSAADLQGKVTLVNFWGTWCPPCRMEFPHVRDIERHYRANDRFQLVSISCSGQAGNDEHMGPMTAEFLDEFKATFPTYRDPHQRFAQHLIAVARLESFVFPTSVLLDENGTIRGLWEGYAPGDEREIQSVIEATLRRPAMDNR